MKKLQFKEFKKEIIERCKIAGACEEEFKKVVLSKNYKEITKILKNNFYWCCNNKIFKNNILKKSDSSKYGLFENQNISFGYGIVTGNCTVIATGNNTIIATGNSTVKAYGNSTVNASDNSTVEATDNSTVKAYDNSTIKSFGNSTVNATGNSTVEAYDNSYVNSCSMIECKVSGGAILRYRNKIFSNLEKN